MDSFEQRYITIRNCYHGLREGATMFAWWKDGLQYAGNCGKKLLDVLEEIDQEEADRLPALKEEYHHG